ncbi:MAG: hypothetical protein L6R37_004998 [Teloschistes peruensis]|nr:MAG: hypothetical protein L6R37_004998 [Teloschistes peruensis]
MPSTKSSLAAFLLALAPLASAHVLLETPVPYGAATLNTNPLLEDGSDYPCKQREGVYAVTKVNVMPIGQPQTISFQGQATHGGGACQVSLTTDTPPTKDSVFKVIKTIVGGCPSTNPGNVGNDPFGHGADKFQFSIPDTIPAGKNYTMAWTWFNKIGNREMYMNCAPITVPASSQRRFVHDAASDTLKERDFSAMSALPDMFRANIGSMGNGCLTPTSGSLVAIPKDNVGTNVRRIGTEALIPPVGNCGGTYGAPGGAPSPDTPKSNPQPAVPVESATAAPVQPTPKSNPQPAVPVESATAAPVQPTTTTVSPPPVSISTVPIVTPVPPSQPSTVAPVPAKPSTAPAAPPVIPGLLTGTCSTPGKSVCSPDGTTWGTCDQHNTVIFQKAPIGTKCDPTLGTLVHTKRSRVFIA